MTHGHVGIGIISNPGSGHNRDHFSMIRVQLDCCPGSMHRVTQSKDDIHGVLSEFAAAGIGTLVVNGGDGTASAVLGELLERKTFTDPPDIILLPAGTANMNAGDIGVRGSLKRAVRRLSDWAVAPQTATEKTRRCLMRVTVDDKPAPYYGMFLGAGAIIHGTEYAHRNIHARGLRDDFSLLLGTIRTVWGVLRDEPEFTRPSRIALGLDDREPTEHDTLILALSTLHRLAFGMQPFWGEGKGKLRVTLIQQHAGRFLTTFLSIIRGKPNAFALPGNGYHSDNANSLQLGLAGEINLDGEILTVARQVNIEASAALDFLRL